MPAALQILSSRLRSIEPVLPLSHPHCVMSIIQHMTLGISVQYLKDTFNSGYLI